MASARRAWSSGHSPRRSRRRAWSPGQVITRDAWPRSAGVAAAPPSMSSAACFPATRPGRRPRAWPSSGLTALPGAAEAIDKLSGSGIRVCLVTGLPRDMLGLVLDTLGWRGHADLALCPDDAPRAFPWPDLVLTAMLRLGAGDVREVAMAAGTEHALAAARRAGAGIVAGVRTGPHTPARMRQAGATHLIDSIADLPELLASSD